MFADCIYIYIYIHTHMYRNPRCLEPRFFKNMIISTMIIIVITIILLLQLLLQLLLLLLFVIIMIQVMIMIITIIKLAVKNTNFEKIRTARDKMTRMPRICPSAGVRRRSGSVPSQSMRAQEVALLLRATRKSQS